MIPELREWLTALAASHQEWTIADVAKRSAIDVGYLTDFEHGSRWLPTNYAERLEAVLLDGSAAESHVPQLHDRSQAAAERRRVGWSVAELAERSGIDAGYLSDFEQGQRWLPPHYVSRLEAALDSAARRETVAAH